MRKTMTASFMTFVLWVSMIGMAVTPAAATAHADQTAQPVVADEKLAEWIHSELLLPADAPVTTDDIAILTELHIDETMNVASLSGLENATFLQELTVRGNRISRLTPLAHLTNLRVLDVSDNPVQDLSPLLQMPALETVHMSSDMISDSADTVKQLRDKGIRIVEPVNEPEHPSRPAIQVFNNTEPVSFTKDPVIMKGTTMVQFRPLFETFGMDVEWDAATRTVTGKKEQLLIELTMDSRTAKVNGQLVSLPVAPLLLDGHTMIPLRFVGEATGRRVLWDGETQTIDIYTSITSINLEILYADDTRYEGERRDGVPHGKGTFTHKGQIFYEGEVRDGMIEGQGKMYDVIYPASYYEGTFVNNRYHGEGKLVYGNGHYYIGPFVDGNREGEGKMYDDTDTLLYSGMFHENAYSGSGIGYMNNYMYEGMYAKGTFEGSGKMYYQGRLVFEGEWSQGERKNGKMYFFGSLIYEGSFENDYQHGFGVFYDESGTVLYRGQVVQGEKTGVGILYYENRDRYIGEVLKGEPVGQGVRKSADGTIKSH
ncbi:stalk domain-containing protein [Marinicrinis sediminis]|uniref:Stalk domain-containing protein n=1 Tax=Marinicrinis sediminis TaxID=1652465 RepID=A0ABW5R7T2_9BACL